MLSRIIHSEWCKAASTTMQHVHALSSSHGTLALSSGLRSSSPSSAPIRCRFPRKLSSDVPQNLSHKPNLKRLTSRIVQLTRRRQLDQVVCLSILFYFILIFSQFFSFVIGLEFWSFVVLEEFSLFFLVLFVSNCRNLCFSFWFALWEIKKLSLLSWHQW